MAKIKKFGTFGGVFIPSILTILGVIMYMRLPFIVGEAGLWLTLGIIVVAHIISITTGLSISSMATDKKVEAGGPYYIISRSLGLPIGGTLGLALFVGLSFSISLYLIGFSESYLPFMGYEVSIRNIRIVGSLALLVLTTITFISTSLAIKAQFFILGAIALSIISIFFGNHDLVPEAPLFKSSSSAVSLMVLFGVFFPAVTGFSAGVSMSGDLEDPKKSIPKGTIAAIAVGFIIYVVLAIFFAVSIERNALITDPQILLNISWIPELVVAGIWGATLSSALGSILGAPRILQAISVDKISPRIFAKGYGATNEPRNAVILAFIIAEAGILIGELDVIARIVSIFFITTYGFLNISAAFEKWTSTEYRPDFKVSGWVSLLGAIACLVVMIQLDFVAMLGAVLILGLIYFYLKRKELTLDSGDAWSGVWASLVKTGLTNLTKDKLQKKNWRPNVIMFSGNPANRSHMIDMGKSIVGKLGLLSAFELVVSDDKIMAKSHSDLEKGKDEIGFFKHKLHTRDIYSGMDQIARIYGFSGVEPNTVLMGWSKNPTNKDRFLDLLESFGQEKFNTLFLNYDHDRGYGDYHTVDIWWSGSGRNLALAINLIKHITNASVWSRAKVRVLVINPVEAESENIYKKTFSILDQNRLEADIKIINNEIEKRSSKEIITEESKKSDLTVLGVPENRFRDFGKYFDRINETVSNVGSSLIINASSDFEDLEVVTQVKAKQIDENDISVLSMPDLEPSKYEEITLDLQKIDINGKRVLDQLFEKTLRPIFSNHRELLEELEDRGDSINKELDKICL
ncbi:MAG: amino acid permease, partial [Bacteroidia bacterium]